MFYKIFIIKSMFLVKIIILLKVLCPIRIGSISNVHASHAILLLKSLTLNIQIDLFQKKTKMLFVNFVMKIFVE